MEKALSHIKDPTIFTRKFCLIVLEKPTNVIDFGSGKAEHYKAGVHVIDKSEFAMPMNLKFYSSVVREWNPENQSFTVKKSRR